VITKAVVILLLTAYLAGSLPFGLWLVRAVKGVDVRSFGSGNTGTINVFRVGGTGLGIAVFSLDVLKGFVPVWIAGLLAFPPPLVVAVGLAAIIGHNWSLYLKFSGGKGVATSLGVVIALSWPAALIAFAIYLAVVLATRYSSLASMTAAVAAPVIMWRFDAPPAYIGFGVLAALFVLYRHRANIGRLARGEELKLNLRRGK